MQIYKKSAKFTVKLLKFRVKIDRIGSIYDAVLGQFLSQPLELATGVWLPPALVGQLRLDERKPSRYALP